MKETYNVWIDLAYRLEEVALKKIFYFIEGVSPEKFRQELDTFLKDEQFRYSVKITDIVEDKFHLNKSGLFGRRIGPILLQCTYHPEETGLLLVAELKYAPTIFDIAMGLAWILYPIVLHSFPWFWWILAFLYPLMLMIQRHEIKKVFFEIPAYLYEHRV